MSIFQSPYDDIPSTDLSITERIFSGISQDPGKVVLIDGVTGATMSAAVLMDRVKRLAGGLQAAGFGVGKTVALMAANTPEYVVIFHAIAWAGGTITTINPSYTGPEVSHQLADAGADLLITTDEALEAATTGAGNVPVVAIGTPQYDALFGTPLDAQTPVDLDDHVVVLPYSSGTTGLPKGVMLTHRNLVSNVDQTRVGTEMADGETVIAFLPFFHIYGMVPVFNLFLAVGGKVVTMPRFDLPQFLQLTQDHQAERMLIVPPVALALEQHPIVDQYDLSNLKSVIIAAAPSSAALTDALADRLGCVVGQGYGMTELGPVSHCTSVSNHRSGASGLLVPNTSCKVVDPETEQLVPAGNEGELWIKGPQVMKGYLNNPEATAKTITKDGWLRTGDLARVDEDGYMFIVDRLKELIKFKGFQVPPAELEATLVAMDGITDAAVIGLPDDVAGELPIAFVVRADGGPDQAAISAYFQANLATYKQLHDIRFVDAVPKSASGKILRRVLRDQVAAQ